MTFLSTIPASLHSAVLFQLYQALPLPHDALPETLEARNDIAKLAVARLGPMNMGEVLLAIQAVASEAHALDALSGASLHHHDPVRLQRSRAQSALMTRQAAQARKELRITQEARWEAERQRQAETEAATQAAEESDRRADEAMVVPFMRRLAQRRVAAQKSHHTGRNPVMRSHETDSWQPRLSRSQDDPTAAARARGTTPKPAAATAA